jgi:hypothetical protein
MAGLDMMLKALGFDPKEFEEKIKSAFDYLNTMSTDIAEIKASQKRTEENLNKLLLYYNIKFENKDEILPLIENEKEVN